MKQKIQINKNHFVELYNKNGIVHVQVFKTKIMWNTIIQTKIESHTIKLEELNLEDEK